MTLRELEKTGALAPEWTLESAAAVLRPPGETGAQLPRIGWIALGIGAWLTGIFLIGFLVTLFGIRNEESMALIGVLLVIASVFLLRWKKSHPFLEQLALAFGLAGYVMSFIGSGDLFTNDLAGPFLVALLLLVPVYWFSPHFVQRFFAGLWVWLTWWGTAMSHRSAGLGEPLFLGMLLASLAVILAILGGMPKFSGPFWRPALWSAITGLGGGLVWLTNSFDDRLLSVRVEWLFGAASSLGCVAVLWHLLRPGGKGLAGLITAGVLLVGLALAGAPGVVVSLALMLLAHARGERFLEGVAVTMLTLFLIAFYYHLGLPLNQKSITLMIAGAFLLGLRWWFGRGGELPGSVEKP